MTHMTRRAALVWLLGGLAWLAARDGAAAEPAGGKPASNGEKAVRLVIDYGDGVQTHYKQIAWKPGQTVIDALVVAGGHARPLKYSQRGRGAGAMITEIAGLKNEGSGRNWLFSINGEEASVGAGATELKAGDTILWEFKRYEYNP